MTNKELIEYLRQYPLDAEIKTLSGGHWDDGENFGNDPERVGLDPEEDLQYSDRDNTLFIGRW